MSISFGDASLAQMRLFIATIERELAAGSPSSELRAAWDGLVSVLALGPEPELRTCPHCKASGMRAATRCSRCWSALPLLAPLAPAEPASPGVPQPIAASGS